MLVSVVPEDVCVAIECVGGYLVLTLFKGGTEGVRPGSAMCRLISVEQLGVYSSKLYKCWEVAGWSKRS